jgi:hypothetical protein
MKSVFYALEIKILDNKYRNDDSLANSTLFQTYESSTPFAPIQVGDSICDGKSLSCVGEVQHINHWIGDFGENQILHKLVVFVYEHREYPPVAPSAGR